jgi:hypothetical protein
MDLTPVVIAEPQGPAPGTEPYLVSYASEDYDVAEAFYQRLQALGETVFDRIKIFFDSKSIDGGDEIRADVRAGLNKSDFLVDLYTGLFKRSDGHTGYEVGLFDGLIVPRDEILRAFGRRIEPGLWTCFCWC